MQDLFGQVFALFILIVGLSWLVGGKSLAGRSVAWPFELLGWALRGILGALGQALRRVISDIYNHFFPPRPRRRRP